jgi:folate-binding protein YgfZ
MPSAVSTSSDPAGGETYTHVRSGAGCCLVDRTVLTLRGAETPEFLDRISTNLIRDISRNEVRTTLLLNEKGRFVDCVDILHLGDEFLLVGSGAQRNELKRWIEHYIIMEDISVSDESDHYASFCFLGGRIVTEILKIPHNVGRITTGVNTFQYVSAFWPGTITYISRMHDGSPNLPIILNESFEVREIPASLLEIFRIEAGIPLFGSEMTSNYTPLETGLRRFISFTKGCYTGQEVVARTDSQQKVQRQLIGIRPENATAELKPLMELRSSNELVGQITSVCWSYGLDSRIALAYRKTAAHGGELQADDKMKRFPVSAVQLPFLEI